VTTTEQPSARPIWDAVTVVIPQSPFIGLDRQRRDNRTALDKLRQDTTDALDRLERSANTAWDRLHRDNIDGFDALTVRVSTDWSDFIAGIEAFIAVHKPRRKWRWHR
jgi:hypothetical protein